MRNWPSRRSSLSLPPHCSSASGVEVRTAARSTLQPCRASKIALLPHGFLPHTLLSPGGDRLGWGSAAGGQGRGRPCTQSWAPKVGLTCGHDLVVQRPCTVPLCALPHHLKPPAAHWPGRPASAGLRFFCRNSKDSSRPYLAPPSAQGRTSRYGPQTPRCRWSGAALIPAVCQRNRDQRHYVLCTQPTLAVDIVCRATAWRSSHAVIALCDHLLRLPRDSHMTAWPRPFSRRERPGFSPPS
ncbi:hypothetical protein IQ07DRAFT_659693 [Pyrenochaeta sp. DS3sAY3a]|nr:hypothetical protein IQ07DRAFT_659693 [Pyrenochaeta sp. DS3sAY3a]